MLWANNAQWGENNQKKTSDTQQSESTLMVETFHWVSIKTFDMVEEMNTISWRAIMFFFSARDDIHKFKS